MRSSALLCLVPFALCATASTSPASVTISNAATANMTCSGGVCAPTAADAVLNVQDIEAMLGSGNATVTTTGSGVQAKDIDIKAPLTWSVATTLALDAYRSIEINAKVSVAGKGGVFLTTNDGGSGGEFACNDNGRLELGNLSSTLNINGTSYQLVDSVASLASAVTNNPGGAFALARDYNAKKDGTYTSSPIAPVFVGSFNGLGNTISNLSINDQTEDATVALFAETWTGSTIANVRLVNESVQSGSDSLVGGLVSGGYGGSVAHSFNTGIVNGSIAGGLLGFGGDVTGSGSTATVSGSTYAGGLIGESSSGSASNSWATGNVSGANGNDGGYVGGLIGVIDHYDIRHSRASGQVTTTGTGSAAGGLVGGILTVGSIDRSYATGTVTCQYNCGGLLGWFGSADGPGKVSQSFATGSVTSTSSGGFASAGGLVGSADGCDGCDILNSYALGAVSGPRAGGFVGQNGIDFPHRSISSSYATGAVSGTSETGGLLGYDSESPNGLIKRAYWDLTTSGITNRSQGAGSPANDPGIKGLSDKELKSGLPKGFDPKIWKEDSSINNGWPYLIHNPPAK